MRTTRKGSWAAALLAAGLMAGACEQSDPRRADERGARGGGAGTSPGDIEAARGGGNADVAGDGAAVEPQAGKTGAAEVTSGVNPGASGSAAVDQTGAGSVQAETAEVGQTGGDEVVKGGIDAGAGLEGGNTVATRSGQDRASAIGLGLDAQGGTVYEITSMGNDALVMKPVDEATTGAGGERRNQAGYELSLPRAEADALGLAGVTLKEGSRVIVVRSADGTTASIRPE